MMDDFKYGPGAPAESAEPAESVGSAEQPVDAGAEPKTETVPDAPVAVPVPETPVVSDAVVKFRSCRWRATPEDGEFCTHRDVLPFAGKEGFVAESWCPDCAFYKLRRTPKKRERLDFTY